MNSKVLFFMLFACLVSFSAQAQTTPPVKEKDKSEMKKDKQLNADKVEVMQKDLPATVQKTLSSDTYKDWSFKKAYRVKSTTGEHFEVTVHKGDQKTTLKLDANGKIVS